MSSAPARRSTEFAAKVESSVRDYGDWNSSYDYIVDADQGVRGGKLLAARDGQSRRRWHGVSAPRHSLVIARWIDPATGRRARRSCATRWSRDPHAPLDAAMKERTGNSGRFYVRLGNVVAAVGVAQVRKSDGSGTPRGYVVMVAADHLGADLAAASGASRARPRRGRCAWSRPAPRPCRSRCRSRAPTATGRRRQLHRCRATCRCSAATCCGSRCSGSTILLAIVLAVLSRMISRLVLEPLGRVEGHMQRVRDFGIAERARGRRQAAGRNRLARAQLQFDARPAQGSARAGRGAELRARPLRKRGRGDAQRPQRAEPGIDDPERGDRPDAAGRPRDARQGDGRTGARRRARANAAPSSPRSPPPRSRPRTSNAPNAATSSRSGATRCARCSKSSARNSSSRTNARRSRNATRPRSSRRTRRSRAIRATARRSRSAFPAKPHPVLANRLLLSQVVGNLFSNAAEAIVAAGGSGNITVTIERNRRRQCRNRDPRHGRGVRYRPTRPTCSSADFRPARTNRAGWACTGAPIR